MLSLCVSIKPGGLKYRLYFYKDLLGFASPMLSPETKRIAF